MKSAFLPLIAATFLMSACAALEPAPVSAEREDVSYREAIIESVDQETRQILLTSDVGKRLSFIAGPEVRNLAQVEAGDVVRIGYYEAVAVRVADPNDPGGAVEVSAAERAEEGEKPGVAASSVANLVVEFISYDPDTAIATFVTPDGILHATQVHPKMRAFAEGRTAGERLEVSIEQALAISVEALPG